MASKLRARDLGREEHEVHVPCLHPLPLYCYRGPAGCRRAVLLLHGASTTGDIFRHPNGGLVEHLRHCSDVWTLEWRGGHRVVDSYAAVRQGLPVTPEECRLFSIDSVARVDIPGAVRVVVHNSPEPNSVAIVGFCVGAGAAARAAELGELAKLKVSKLVLMTLGLFYQTPWDGWLKAQDYLLERALTPDCQHRAIHPLRGHEWPEDMESAYRVWPASWFGNDTVQQSQLLKRTSFMFGHTLGPAGLSPLLTEEILAQQYGGMHIGLYAHLGQMVRRGFAAEFDAPEVSAVRGPAGAHRPLPDNFRDLDVTLITGAQNRLWHRDGIDRMYEWLLRRGAAGGGRRAKHVLPKFGHLDLLWSNEAEQVVYPLIQAAVCGGT